MKKDPNGNAVGKLKSPHSTMAIGNTIDWMMANAELLQKTIATAGYKHVALRFGTTRDGGAYAIGVYAGIQYFTDYVRPGEDIDSYLDGLLKALDEYEPDDTMPTGKQRTR